MPLRKFSDLGARLRSARSASYESPNAGLDDSWLPAIKSSPAAGAEAAMPGLDDPVERLRFRPLFEITTEPPTAASNRRRLDLNCSAWASNRTRGRCCPRVELRRAAPLRRGVSHCEESSIMDDIKAVEILKSLAAGMDPAAGQPLTSIAPLQSPDVVRALFLAADRWRCACASRGGNRTLPRNAGKPWSSDEDERLLAGFDAGTQVDELPRARAHACRHRARLVKHGRLEAEQAPAHASAEPPVARVQSRMVTVRPAAERPAPPLAAP
jgi:hypothetical protein